MIFVWLRPSQYPSTLARSRQRHKMGGYSSRRWCAVLGPWCDTPGVASVGGVPAPPPYLNNPYAIFKKSELNRVANGDGLNSFRRGCRAYCGQQFVAACRVGLYDIREALRILRRKGGCADGDILRCRVSRGHG